jgi:uncharacterized protein (DUF1330 family)
MAVFVIATAEIHDSEEQARRCFDSPEYAPLRELRHRSAATEMVVVGEQPPSVAEP